MVRPGVYGDYVIDDPSEGIQPGQTRLHEMAIGIDHPPGTYWYHTHLHGSTAVQVASGMAGGLIVTGATDDVPEIAAARERLFVFQAPIFDPEGRLESFSQVASPTAERPFRVNGVRCPRLVMRPGEVQKWRFLNAGVANFLNLSLDAHPMHLYAFDGNPRVTLKRIEPARSEGLVLAPGNRGDVLVKAGAPGTYYLRTLRYDMGNAEPLPEDILAEVEVSGDPLDMPLPTGALPLPEALAPITDAELAAHGGLKRIIVMRAVFNDSGAPITEQPASDVLPMPPGEPGDWTYQTDGTFLADTVFAVGTDGSQASPQPALPTQFIPVQSSRAIRQTVALGSVEEWTLFNMNHVQHPFHIHVNPFQVVKVNGIALAEPYWADTIGLPRGGTPTAPSSVTIRTRFTDFPGAYVMHCHILSHEDMGMMQIVEVV
jgi:FtsP/CotA-like multicopper oxidase with cupredoxin domain